jgi:hypothetical protein
MADRVYIQWSIVNWITIVLMAALGAVLIGVVAAGIKTYNGGGE